MENTSYKFVFVVCYLNTREYWENTNKVATEMLVLTAVVRVKQDGVQ